MLSRGKRATRLVSVALSAITIGMFLLITVAPPVSASGTNYPTLTNVRIYDTWNNPLWTNGLCNIWPINDIYGAQSAGFPYPTHGTLPQPNPTYAYGVLALQTYVGGDVCAGAIKDAEAIKGDTQVFTWTASTGVHTIDGYGRYFYNSSALSVYDRCYDSQDSATGEIDLHWRMSVWDETAVPAVLKMTTYGYLWDSGPVSCTSTNWSPSAAYPSYNGLNYAFDTTSWGCGSSCNFNFVHNNKYMIEWEFDCLAQSAVNVQHSNYAWSTAYCWSGPNIGTNMLDISSVVIS